MKKERLTSQPMMDQISSLPDEILTSNILCRLSLREAVRTTTLSKRWRHLFSCIPCLDFHEDLLLDCPDVYEKCMKRDDWIKILNFPCRWDKWWEVVEHIVCSHAVSPTSITLTIRGNMDKLHYHAPIDRILRFIFDSWNTVIQKVDLSHHRWIPPTIFKCHSLVDMDLTFFTLKLPDDFVGLPKLKRVKLRGIYMANIEFETFVSRCESLEELVFSLHCINRRGREGTLNVRSKSLVSIDWKTEAFGWNLSLKDCVASSLRRAYVSLDVGWGFVHNKLVDNVGYDKVAMEKQRFLQLLAGFGSLDCLSFEISQYYYEIFSEMPRGLPQGMLLICLKKLILKLRVMMDEEFHHFLYILLYNAPNLEELIVEFNFIGWPSPPYYCWEDQIQNPIQCRILHRLKRVMLQAFDGTEQCFNFAKFLLNSAEAYLLEQMKITCIESADCHTTVDLEKLRLLRKSDRTILEINLIKQHE